MQCKLFCHCLDTTLITLMLVSGEEVNWVQCDRCEEWYHLLCVGLGTDEVTEDEEYECFKCKNSDSALTYVHSSSTSVEGVVNSLRESMEHSSMTANPEGVVQNSVVRESITISTSSGVTATRETEVLSREDVEVGSRDKTDNVPAQIQAPIKIQEFCSQKSLVGGKVLESTVCKSVTEKLEADEEEEGSVISEEEDEELMEDSVEDNDPEEMGAPQEEGSLYEETPQKIKGESPTDSVIVADILDGMMTRLDSPVTVKNSVTEENKLTIQEVETMEQTADES